MVVKAEADYLFEVSWEVCNKVGGISTVIKTKTPEIQKYYKNFFLIGPYFKKNAEIELDSKEPPMFLKKAFDRAEALNVKCYFGEWGIVKGSPFTILIDFSRLIDKKNDIKKDLWDKYKVDSLSAGWDFEEPIIFSYAVYILLREIESELKGKKLIVHCHEWMTGASALWLKAANSTFKSVFTTHATMLGRTITGSGGNLYEYIDKIKPLDASYAHHIEAKHLTEVACAQNCHVFTTVSEITGLEGEKLLGKKPDMILPNGIDFSRFPTFEEAAIKHVTSREKIKEFIAFHFFPHYPFDIDKLLIFFITGRFEFRDKGIDITIDALARLNDRLKEENYEKHIVTIFWVPVNHYGVKVELLENKNYYFHIKNYVLGHSESILRQVLFDFLCHKSVGGETLFTKDFIREMKKDLLHFTRGGNPLFCTHYIDNEEENEIIKYLIKNGLDNRQDDKIKVIYMPVYLDGEDQLINMPYETAIAGCHLGMFPSYYEPWGYTPMECAGMGVPAVTSDLAGFGLYIKDKIREKNPGIFVIERKGKSYEESVKKMADVLYRFAMFDNENRNENKIRAKEIVMSCSWTNFAPYYIEAHNLALKK